MHQAHIATFPAWGSCHQTEGFCTALPAKSGGNGFKPIPHLFRIFSVEEYIFRYFRLFSASHCSQRPFSTRSIKLRVITADLMGDHHRMFALFTYERGQFSVSDDVAKVSIWYIIYNILHTTYYRLYTIEIDYILYH
jgi:hypothetical protein